MSNDLVQKANKVKSAVDQCKEDYAATKREYDVNKKAFEDTLADAKTKFGVNSYEELKALVAKYEKDITDKLSEITTTLEEAGIDV